MCPCKINIVCNIAMVSITISNDLILSYYTISKITVGVLMPYLPPMPSVCSFREAFTKDSTVLGQILLDNIPCRLVPISAAGGGWGVNFNLATTYLLDFPKGKYLKVGQGVLMRDASANPRLYWDAYDFRFSHIIELPRASGRYFVPSYLETRWMDTWAEHQRAYITEGPVHVENAGWPFIWP